LRILYLTSDWKWTGPAEPMLVGAMALRARGHEVEIACPDAPGGERGLLTEARARGVEPALILEPLRGIRPWRDGRDARRLRAVQLKASFDIVHVWHSRAHGLALRARLRRGAGSALVRAHTDGAPPRLGERWLFEHGCDALVCTSERCAAGHDRVGHAVAGAVDLQRFRPVADENERRSARRRLGVDEAAPLVGVVARVQRHRRFDLLLEAVARLRATHPALRLVVFGRGTHLDTVARRPAIERGLGELVVFAGHLSGEDYAASLRALDALCFLVPGSDGGCRAVLEAAASGVPAVVSRRGALPEIVVDSQTGRLVDEQPEGLADGLDELLSAPGRCRSLGAAARTRAESSFSPERLARDLERIYAVLRPA